MSALAGQVNFDAAVSLALTLDFARDHPRHFGAPAARSAALEIGGFNGSVARGASCNCQSIMLVPHCNGTHTESVSHLTVQSLALQNVVPAGPITALLLTVPPQLHTGTNETSSPAPRGDDRLITLKALESACGAGGRWRSAPSPRALLLRTGTHWKDNAPPYLSAELARALVARGIEHLVTDLPSVDRLQDEGLLTTHRIFFGLPAGSTDIAAATRAQCTITELATFPATLDDGPCAVQLQIPAFSGDAVPSRPLYVPYK